MARSKSDKAFDERVAQYSEELRELLTDLYGEQADEAFRNLTELMAKAHDARPADLKRLDTKRLADPEWYKRGNMFGMTMYTDLFAGDLKKLADKVPYLKEQKLTYLHLMPLLKMPHPQNDGGYAVEDFDTVDPSLGTNEDLAALTKKLRAAGISLCLDFVMNHTASSHRWAKAAQAGDPKYQDYYYCHDDRTIPDQYDAVVPEVFPATAPGNFTWNEQMHKWVLTSFYPFQWDLNYRNPNVLVSVLSSVLGLANLGVEVFRIDAVPYIWKELGTNCRNLPQVHAIVRMLRIVLECVCPAVVLKGEVVMAPKELAAYFGTPEKPECHMLYNVSIMVNLWSALASGDVRLLKDQLDKLNALPENCWFVNYLRCHDDIGWGVGRPGGGGCSAAHSGVGSGTASAAAISLPSNSSASAAMRLYRYSETSVPSPTFTPWSGMGLPRRRKSISRKCDMWCSAPLAGRELPAMTIAYPETSRARIRSFSPATPPARRVGRDATQPSSASRMSAVASVLSGSPVSSDESFQSVRQQNFARMSPTPAPVMIRGASRRISISKRMSRTVCAFSVTLNPFLMSGVTPEA